MGQLVSQLTKDLVVPSLEGDVGATFRGGNPIVVFSHGFGVKRDSLAMFSDICSALPSNWGFILFDYNGVDGQNITLAPYESQVQKLQAVLEFAHSKSKSVYLIGHSMGAITSCIAGSTVPEKIVLLTPPVHGPRPKSNNSWAERPGAYYDGSTLIVPRKDGTFSIIPKAFFEQSSKVDCTAVITEYSAIKNLVVVQALQEEVISHTENYDKLPSETLSLIKIPGNHNFDPPHRDNLIKTILDILST